MAKYFEDLALNGHNLLKRVMDIKISLASHGIERAIQATPPGRKGPQG